MNYNIIRLMDRPEIKEKAAEWFHEKWGIPSEAYRESMEECLLKKNFCSPVVCCNGGGQNYRRSGSD